MLLKNECSSQELADLIGLGKRSVEKLAQKGIVVKLSRGRYEPNESLKNYLDHLSKKIPKETAKQGFEKEKTKLYKHRAEITRLKAEEKKETLLNKHDEKQSMFRLGKIIRSRIMLIPERISHVIASENDHNAVNRILDDELYNVLLEISDLDLDEDDPVDQI